MSIQEALEKVAAILPGAEKVAKAEKDLGGATEKVTALEGKLSTAEASAKDFENQLKAKDDAHAKAIADLEAKHAKAITDLSATHTTALEAKEADVEKRAGLKAQAIAQGRGLKTPPKEEGQGGTGASGATLLEQFNAIKDPKAKGEFYQAHRNELP